MRILLISYDNGFGTVSWPIQGLMYIASVLRDNGHYVENYAQDQYHYSEKHLLEHLLINSFDVVGISFVSGYYPYKKMKEIMTIINKLDQKPIVIAGGHMFQHDPEYFLRRFGIDFIINGEGIDTIKELLPHESVGHDEWRIDEIDGISYLDDDRYIKNKSRKLIKNPDDIPLPAWDLYPIDYYALIKPPKAESGDRVFPVLSSYGCYGDCNFCQRMEKGMRLRSPENIVMEIKYLKEEYNINYIFFSDELFVVSKKRGMELANAFLEADLNIKYWCCGRLDRVDREVLSLMKKSGCVFVNYGIESYDNEMLKVMKKKLTTDQIDVGVEATIDAEISPGLNLMFGNKGETFEILHKGKNFLLKYDDQSQLRTIRPVSPYPGTPLFDNAVKMGKVKDVEDFYENKHKNSDLVSINFTEYTDEQIHKELYKVNCQLLENYHNKYEKKQREQLERLYYGDGKFRGFRG
jgi:radical SAM superfamily enzyme YgiQ (UPF0313 family)